MQLFLLLLICVYHDFLWQSFILRKGRQKNSAGAAVHVSERCVVSSTYNVFIHGGFKITRDPRIVFKKTSLVSSYEECLKFSLFISTEFIYVSLYGKSLYRLHSHISKFCRMITFFRPHKRFCIILSIHEIFIICC